MVENGFTARKCNFQGDNGYMVSQYVNGKEVVSQFVREEYYEKFCETIGCKPVIDENNPVFPTM